MSKISKKAKKPLLKNAKKRFLAKRKTPWLIFWKKRLEDRFCLRAHDNNPLAIKPFVKQAKKKSL
jgi:hypothetical protein